MALLHAYVHVFQKRSPMICSPNPSTEQSRRQRLSLRLPVQPPGASSSPRLPSSVDRTRGLALPSAPRPPTARRSASAPARAATPPRIPCRPAPSGAPTARAPRGRAPCGKGRQSPVFLRRAPLRPDPAVHCSLPPPSFDADIQ
ncbi:hypothetical protein GUJ93_ZPchr0007g3506 [Zizania palustris]|uniref:Uncharacterized protein n=1 Tax=Zizania palustris TaxID=103762 RepID=A0A8J5SRC5_ZIZPA|nr:hypothetical protein GUJ93_ZPchr0007g3506 [Zizania palustris]